MHRRTDGPLAPLWRWEGRCGKLVAIAREDHYASARRDGPHGFEDDLAFMQVVRPGIRAAEAPITGEGNGRNDKLPFHATGFAAG